MRVFAISDLHLPGGDIKPAQTGITNCDPHGVTPVVK